MKRRSWLAWGCAHCLGLGSTASLAQSEGWTLPGRFTRPDLATDEGGLWAMMDREETRLRRSSFLIRDQALRTYLQEIACKLGADHCPDVRVYAVRTPWFNASMAPNGMMQIWSGLLLRVDNEAQLASIIGHEIGHYLQRHSIEQLRDIRARSAFGQLLGAALGGVGLIAQLAIIAGAYAYSRDHERDADRIGLELMTAAGYDPREASTVWNNLRQELTAGAGGDPAKKSVMFATHPPSDERGTELARLAGDRSGFRGEDEYARQLRPFLIDLLDDELRRGQYDETLVLLDRLRLKPALRAVALCYRAETRRLRAGDGDVELALADLDDAMAASAAEGSTLPAHVHRTRAYIHQSRGDKAAARDAFERYLEQAPQSPDAGMIRNYLAELQT